MENINVTNKDISAAEHVFRLNLINSISGIKPGNLIGTLGADDVTNLAIFSSVVHLGSQPPLLGFILRPNTEVKRHTWENIKHSGYFTINHIHEDIIQNAHFTSTKFEASVSEFEKCKLTEEFMEGFPAPFVAESRIKIGLRFKELIPIKINGTSLVIGEIIHLVVPKDSLAKNGRIDLSKANSVGVSGLNRYYSLHLKEELPFARIHELPDFK